MFEMMPFTRNRGVDLYRPFRDLEDLERSLFSGNSLGGFQTDVKDMGDAFVLEADLPGVKKEDIHIDIDGDRLSISAQRSSGSEEKDQATISAVSAPTAPSPAALTSPASAPRTSPPPMTTAC